VNFSAAFIRRPVATSLLMAGIALFGAIAYDLLPVSDLPNVDFPTLTVYASLPGADPATMASAVATPLERQFTTISGVDSMTSTSSLGSCSVTLQFDLSRDIDGAAVDVQTAIAAALPLLPPGMPSPPSFRKVNPSDSPVMHMSVSSTTLPLSKVNEYAETMIAQRISQVPGVAQVQIYGQKKYAVRAQMDPQKLAAYKIGINEVSNALRNWNVNLPTGTLWGKHQSFNVRADGQLLDADAFRPLIVTYRNGAPVRLGDLGTVRDGTEDERTESWAVKDGVAVPGVQLMVMRQPGSNVIEVNDGVRSVLPAIKALIPPSLDVNIRTDRSLVIRDVFRDTKFTMYLTLILVVGVIFVFLRNISATLIPALALPFSIVGTFGVMWVLEYSLDKLSMMAIILAIGFVVDDAIVMLENIVRHLERGEPPMQAALQGSKEIWFTIISMTTSLSAVFLPVLFMSGLMGRLFREFAVTITAAVIISGFVSVSLTPMLASRMLRHTPTEERRWFFRKTEAVFHWSLELYAATLRWSLRHRWVMTVIFFAVIGATGYLFVIIPKGFIPEADNGSLYVNTEMAQGTSYLQMAKYQREVIEILRKEPQISSFMSSIGGSMFSSGANTGRMFLELKPKEERDPAPEFIAKMRPKISRLPGLKATLTMPPEIRIGGRGSRSNYEFTLQSPDTGELYRYAGIMEREIAQLPSVLDVNSDVQMRSPRLSIEVDRDKAAALGVNVQEIASALYSGYGPSWTSTIYSPSNQYRVLLEVEPRYQQYGDMLSSLYLKAANGKLVPLDAVTRRKMDVGPQSINHSGQLPSVTVSFNLKPGVALSQAVDEIRDLASDKIPATMSTSFTGTAKAFEDSMKNLNIMLIVAILVVYIVLGILYESFIHPITILSGLPSAAFGALLTLMIFGVDLNIYAFVGLLLLVGLVKKNAIMQIDFALNAQRERGLNAHDAIFEGCIARFRPILMTTLASMLGAVPMAIGYGAGGEARRPLGLAVIGGLLFSQMVTLYLTPAVYILLQNLSDSFSRRKAKVTEGVHPPIPATGAARS